MSKRRKRLGGQRSINYTEGWIEFADKKVAKGVAASLHMTKIGGKKRSYYSEDQWSLKYARREGGREGDEESELSGTGHVHN